MQVQVQVQVQVQMQLSDQFDVGCLVDLPVLVHALYLSLQPLHLLGQQAEVLLLIPRFRILLLPASGPIHLCFVQGGCIVMLLPLFHLLKYRKLSGGTPVGEGYGGDMTQRCHRRTWKG